MRSHLVQKIQVFECVQYLYQIWQARARFLSACEALKQRSESKQLNEGRVQLSVTVTGSFCTRFLFNFSRSCVKPTIRNHWYSKHFNGETATVLRQAMGGTCTNHGVFGGLKGKCQRTAQLISVRTHKLV